MIRQEWKKLLKNKILVVVLIAIIAIPAIYTTLFLGSMWDPYGKLEQLPVAVVNEDQSAVYNGKNLNVGEKLVENLQEDESLQFHFVNAAVAEKGLEEGTYYMVITIPENFSAHAATLLDEHPQKMELQYETNPGTNYIASKMSDSALEKVKSGVSAEVTKEYAKAVFDSFEEVGTGMTEAADGAEQIRDGLSDASQGNETITENLSVLADSTLEFQNGSETMTASLKTYTDGVSQVHAGALALKDGTDTLKQAADDGVKQIGSGASALKAGVETYTGGVAQAYAGTQQLVASSDKLNQGVQALDQGSADLKSGSMQVSDGLEQLSQGIDRQTSESSKDLESVKQGLNQVDSGMQAVNASLVEIQKQLLAAGDTAGAAALDQLIGSKEYQTLVASTPTVAQGAQTAIQQLQEGTAQVKETLDQKLIPGSRAVSQGAEQLSQSISGENGLGDGIHAYTAGVSRVNEGLSQLNQNSAALQEGTDQLLTGSGELAAGLGSGITQIQNGAGELADGTNTLVQNRDALLEGSGQLTEGAGQIADGSEALEEGSKTLGSGLAQLQDGAGTLQSSIADGAEEVNEIQDGDANVDMFASPIEAEKSEQTTVLNNGHAMAAYMMSVGLWVACIAFCLMYSLTEYQGEMKSGVRWWLSKVSVSYLVIILSSIVMVLLLHVCNGFEPERMAATIGVASLAGITFMSMMYFFNALMGKVGSFVMLIFMVVQLAGSAGTYPIEISGGFVAKIHNFLPFSYTVDAFRKTICGAGSLYVDVRFLVVLTLIFSIASLLVYESRAVKIRQGKTSSIALLEKYGLI